MAISKDKKKELIGQYQEDLKNANTVVILRQSAIPVGVSTQIRKEVVAGDSKINVVRKRLFLKALESTDYEKVGLEDLNGPIIVLFSNAQESGSLKVINKYLKQFKKEKAKSELSFLGGWFDKKRQTADYVGDLANMPTKEELLSKLLRLLKYPIQSLTSVLDQIAKKKETTVGTTD